MIMAVVIGESQRPEGSSQITMKYIKLITRGKYNCRTWMCTKWPAL